MKAVTVNVMDVVLQRYLQLLHPYMPHLSEELWTQLSFSTGEMLAVRPLDERPLLSAFASAAVLAAAQRAGAVYETAGRIRNLKASCGFASRRDLEFILKPAAPVQEALIPVLRTLAGAGAITLSPGYTKGKNTGATLAPLGEVYLPLEGLIDVEAERARLSKELEKVTSEIEKVDAKLASESFVSRAPAEVVEEHQLRRSEWKTQSLQLEEMLRNLE